MIFNHVVDERALHEIYLAGFENIMKGYHLNKLVAWGVRNVLCVTGDSPVLSPRPRGRMDINDLDAIQMLWILRRMRAILLMLLDNGLREEELCHIHAKDLKPYYIRVFGKGDKERLFPISECTYDAILAYIQQERRGGAPQQEDFVFITKNWKPIKGDQFYHMIARVGVRAGVKAYPHKFRHTFSINFLRNGGNIFALQAILGHASLEMVKRYLSIAMADIEVVHRSASIVNCWHLGAISVDAPISI